MALCPKQRSRLKNLTDAEMFVPVVGSPNIPTSPPTTTNHHSAESTVVHTREQKRSARLGDESSSEFFAAYVQSDSGRTPCVPPDECGESGTHRFPIHSKRLPQKRPRAPRGESRILYSSGSCRRFRLHSWLGRRATKSVPVRSAAMTSHQDCGFRECRATEANQGPHQSVRYVPAADAEPVPPLQLATVRHRRKPARDSRSKREPRGNSIPSATTSQRCQPS